MSLMLNGSFEILLWGSYLMAREPGWLETHLPLALRNPGGSIWLRRRWGQRLADLPRLRFDGPAGLQ